MILTRARYVPNPDVAAFAWSNLRRFQNVGFVSDAIMELHQLPAEQRHNAERQAEQIRHRLTQAKEYFDAAARVSLATKPALQYYGIMSLALAEVLLKQSGDSRLEILRRDHRHHGLNFSSNLPARAQPALADAGRQLVATPASVAGVRFGTFEIWHRSSRHIPLPSHATFRSHEGESYGVAVIAEPADQALSALPERGISLVEALTNLPSMSNYLDARGVVPGTVRAAVFAQVDQRTGGEQIRINIHPTDRAIFDAFHQNWQFEGVPHQFEGMNQGGILQWNEARQVGQRFRRLPPCAMANRTDWYFWPGDVTLNEFGFFFVARFMMGNYARYFPDQWVRDVERASPLALATEELLMHAEQRVALLALSEMDRFYYIAVN